MKFHCDDLVSDCGVSVSVHVQEQVVDACVGVYDWFPLYSVQRS